MAVSSPFAGPRGRWLSTARLVRDPTKWYATWRERFGDPFTVDALNGKVVVTGRPELVRQVFAARPETYDPFAVDALGSLFGEHLILVLRGRAHAEERKLLSPPFRGDRMRAYGELMQRVGREHADRSFGEGGGAFEAIELTNAISREVIIRAVFGVEDDAAVARFEQAIDALVATVHPVLFFSEATHRPFLGFGPWARMQPRKARVDELLHEEIERRRPVEARGEDILSLLMSARYSDGTAMSDAQLRDELHALLFAGHETTAVALAWAIYHLHSNPETLAQLRDELDANPAATPEEIGKLPYLRAVLNETLRLHPIVPDVLRTLREPLELDGHELPAGLGLAVASCLLHYDPEIYPDPHRFDPNRFLERRFKAHEYMPFGGGHRRCIGAFFAAYEMAQVLAAILSHFELELNEPRPLRATRRNVTMGPSSGVRMRWVGRRG